MKVRVPGTTADRDPWRDFYSDRIRVEVVMAIVFSIAAIALTDVALQLDNALAISSVASNLPPQRRLPVLAGGVLLAAVCLFGFTLVGSQLIDRIAWLKPVAGLALVVIGAKLVFDYLR